MTKYHTSLQSVDLNPDKSILIIKKVPQRQGCASTCHEEYRGSEVQIHSFVTSALHGGRLT